MSQTATEIMPRLRCDVSLRNEDGITAVELAEQLNQAEVLALLQRQNTKQGLGFTVGYRVMDLKTLGNILGGIGGVASTAVPLLFSLRPSSVEIGDKVCSLSASMVASIQATVAGMGNETCSYNITVDEIMGM